MAGRETSLIIVVIWFLQLGREMIVLDEPSKLENKVKKLSFKNEAYFVFHSLDNHFNYQSGRSAVISSVFEYSDKGITH